MGTKLNCIIKCKRHGTIRFLKSVSRLSGSNWLLDKKIIIFIPTTLPKQNTFTVSQFEYKTIYLSVPKTN